MKTISPKLIPELKVTDYQKSLDFYVQLVGFTVLYDRPEDEFAMLGRDGVQIMIEAISSSSRTWKVGKFEYPLGRGINFQIEVTDVQKLYEVFQKNEYPLFVEMEEKWYRSSSNELGNRQFLVQDPDGYLLRFFQDLGHRSVQ